MQRLQVHNYYTLLESVKNQFRMDYECILKVIGRRNIFFVISLTIISFITYITCLQRNVLSISLFQPLYQCELKNIDFNKRDKYNISAYLTFNECKYKQFRHELFKICQSYKFKKNQMIETFITEYSLVCQKKYMIILLYYLQLLNIPLIIFCGYLADNIGRKTCLICLLILHVSDHLAIALIHHLEIRLFLMSLNKLAVFTEMLGLIWILELSAVEYSEFIVIMHFIPGIISSLSVSIISYFARHWIIVYLITSIPTVFWFLIICIPESPRWLLVKNKHKIFIKNMKQIAKLNRIHLSNEFLDEFIEETEWNSPLNMSMTEFSKFPSLKYRLLMLSILGLSISMFPSQFIVNIQILQPFDITMAYGYASLLNTLFLIPLIINLCIKKVAKCIMLTFTVMLIIYIISLFFNQRNYAEMVIIFILSVVSSNLVHSCKIMLITLSNFLMPTTHRCFAVSCIVSSCLFGDTISTVFKEVSSIYRYRSNFNIFVLVSCIFGFLLVIAFHYIMPRVSRGYYPQTSADAELIQNGNENLINIIKYDKQNAFEQRHHLSQ